MKFFIPDLIMNYAENQLSQLLKCIGLQVRKSYNIAEVCSILGISRRTFHYLRVKAEQTGAGGQGLESVIRNNERRVSFSELAAYMARNNTFLNRNGVSAVLVWKDSGGNKGDPAYQDRQG